MTTAIRDGKPGDAAFLAKVMLLASRGHLKRGIWDLIIGRDDAYCLDYLTRLAVMEPTTLCHYSSFIVAECDGHPGAALCGFDPAGGGWASVTPLMERIARELRWTAADQQASGERSAPLWPCIPGQIEGAWVVENVATLPEFRRRGLIDALMRKILDQGRRRDHHQSQITLFIENLAAQKAYEKAGYKFLDERRSPEFQAALGCPGFQRMTRNL
jgi:ribosomal protein S18 acetylase RimI-like enzyme